MKTIIAIALALFAFNAFSQDSTAKAPVIIPPGFKLCDVTYTTDVTVIDTQGVEHNVSTAVVTISAAPYADVVDNSAKSLKVVDLMSKLQDKGGPYDAETGEVRNCDGKGPQKYAPTAIIVRGVTLDGVTQIADEALKQAALINDRFKKRAKSGEKHGWDHNKGGATKRNDLGQRVKD